MESGHAAESDVSTFKSSPPSIAHNLLLRQGEERLLPERSHLCMWDDQEVYLKDGGEGPSAHDFSGRFSAGVAEPRAL